jgi:hypothetical protein
MALQSTAEALEVLLLLPNNNETDNDDVCLDKLQTVRRTNQLRMLQSEKNSIKDIIDR